MLMNHKKPVALLVIVCLSRYRSCNVPVPLR